MVTTAAALVVSGRISGASSVAALSRPRPERRRQKGVHRVGISLFRIRVAPIAYFIEPKIVVCRSYSLLFPDKLLIISAERLN